MIFLLKYRKVIATIAIIAGLTFMVYNHGYSQGYQNRVSYYEEVNKQNFLALNTKIDRVEGLSTTLSLQVQYGNADTKKDLNKITTDIKNKKFSILKNGECVPSEDFINTFNAVINRGNQK
jgi:hypothetical protein